MGQDQAHVFSSPGGARCAGPVGDPWEGGPDWSQGMGPLDSGQKGVRMGAVKVMVGPWGFHVKKAVEGWDTGA